MSFLTPGTHSNPLKTSYDMVSHTHRHTQSNLKTSPIVEVWPFEINPENLTYPGGLVVQDQRHIE